MMHMELKEYDNARKHFEPAAAIFRKWNLPGAKDVEECLGICQMATAWSSGFGPKKKDGLSTLMSLLR